MAERQPAMITIGADGKVKTYDTLDGEAGAIAGQLVRQHTGGHGGIFFVKECPECQAVYGTHGERWENADG